MKISKNKIKKIIDDVSDKYIDISVTFEKNTLEVKFLSCNYKFSFVLTRNYLKKCPTEQIVNYVVGYIRSKHMNIIDNFYMNNNNEVNEIVYRGENICQRLDQM